jgi:hypothetical protein
MHEFELCSLTFEFTNKNIKHDIFHKMLYSSSSIQFFEHIVLFLDRLTIKKCTGKRVRDYFQSKWRFRSKTICKKNCMIIEYNIFYGKYHALCSYSWTQKTNSQRLFLMIKVTIEEQNNMLKKLYARARV